MHYIVNSFSAGMLPAAGAEVVFRPANLPISAADWADAHSAVGHADVAALFSAALGFPVEFNRATVVLAPGDRCLLGQYVGPRLPEGTKVLPAGAEIRWLEVRVSALPAVVVAAAAPARQVKFGTGLRNRSRRPSLWLRRSGGTWVRFLGEALPGLCRVTSSADNGNGGKWAGTDYVLEIGVGVEAVEVCRPFDGWGNSWADLAREGCTAHTGPASGDREPVLEVTARELLPLVAGDDLTTTRVTTPLGAAIARARANDVAL